MTPEQIAKRFEEVRTHAATKTQTMNTGNPQHYSAWKGWKDIAAACEDALNVMKLRKLI